jgi:hypothetical protein
MNKNIPSLGDTANEVFNKALGYETAGFLLMFNVVSEGVWSFYKSTGSFRKVVWIGNIPTSSEVGPYFDSWMVNQISKGFVTITVQSPGKNPHFYSEIHRARGVAIPIDRKD